jgi:hypothetical protein
MSQGKYMVIVICKDGNTMHYIADKDSAKTFSSYYNRKKKSGQIRSVKTIQV